MGGKCLSRKREEKKGGWLCVWTECVLGLRWLSDTGLTNKQ